MRLRASISAAARVSNASTDSRTPPSARLTQAHGLMVNYLYDLDHIEENHEAYAQHRTVVAAKAATSLARAAARDVVGE